MTEKWGRMKHAWFVHPKFKPLLTCKNCGAILTIHTKYKPCPGRVRTQLRENRVAWNDRADLSFTGPTKSASQAGTR